MLKLFKNRNFSYLFWGRVITNMGDSLYNVAAMWLVYEMTHSPFYTGIAGALIMIPQVLEFLVGPLVDKWRLRSILLFTQLFQGLLILLIPITYYLGFSSVWLVMALMFGVVAIEQFVYPAQSAMIPKVLSKEELPEANSLMNIAYKGSDFLLTALAGILIVKIGAINIYLINSITFLLAIMLFKNIHYQDKKVKVEERSSVKVGFQMYKKELLEGFSFVKDSTILQYIIPLIIANFVFGMINAILPAYADLRGGESYYGYYLASLSIGMLSGSLLATYFKNIPLGSVIILSFLFSSFAWGGSFLVGSSILSVILFGISSIGIGIANLLIFTMIQSILPEDMMGRVFSFISSIATILLPLGSFIGGYMATIIGSEYIFGAGSLLCLAIVVYWTTNHSLRRLPAYLEINPDTHLKKKSAS
ncbi:MFS transporter [Rossellomorea sp. SC111]|uniref:MFS transporter n=1 Tax=Rossellomorea sp. SC111 TaxID=2968985 RepID=UPI00215AA7CA|nr:MFS transporter [Rossellomorea sp. SC111]MCR8850510.1 MFS transporter [Rossellomorea sp. SC111]